MPSASDLQQWQRRQNTAVVDDTSKLLSNLPRLPARMKQHYPELEQYEQENADWLKELINALRPTVPPPKP